MAGDDKPSDFDWVTAREQCSPLQMFSMLKSDVEKNVDTMRASSKALGREMHLTVFGTGNFFGVMRKTHAGESGVKFILHQKEIRVESQGTNVGFVAALTLSDDGECRLLVEGKQLDRWQVLRRALEPLLFAVDE